MPFRFFSALALALCALTSLPARAETRVLNRRIEQDQVLAEALRKANLPEPQVEAVISALEGVFDFKRSRVGDQFRLVLRDGELDLFDYRQSAVDEWQVRREGERYVGTKREIAIEKQVVPVTLEITSSLYEAALAAGEDPDIGMALADVFAWDIDFYRDTRSGDRVRAVVEKFVSRGRLVRYGDVLAARYEGQSVGLKKVYRYTLPDGVASYFQEDGSSARKAFLKSPLKYAHVTSRFGMRRHPVLQYMKAHNGVDYGAGIGTPVWAVADGVVTRAQHTGAGGNTVCVRHSNGFESCYLHLSKYGAGVRQGARVSQKQVIAYSGNTGRSTGPHLHFALKKGGAFVNPLNQNFPRSEPMPKRLLPDYLARIAPYVQQLDALGVAQAAAPAPSTVSASP